MDIEDNGGDDDVSGVQAVDTAVKVLTALLEMGAPMSLKAVAAGADMPPPKAHRYLVSFCRGGLAARDPINGGYRLGP
ncbi:MAG TPA: helix-turn-helix domain-containing protein, partial [Ramlibacter sp.]|nr:helix-turn-helix domain-containing protein [Ramlibacter sp.]